MTESELRALVRESIARHLGPGTPSPAGPPEAFRLHASHAVLPVAPGAEQDDGSCVIEPAVRCSHCHYCQSYGH